MTFKIPIYKETTRYSCGAASALMVLNFFKKVKLKRENEFELWKEALALPFKFSSVSGIASIFARRELKVRVITPMKKPKESELKIPFKYENIPKKSRKIEFNYYSFYKESQVKTAKKLGVNFIAKKPTLNDVIESLRYGLVIVHVDDWWLRKYVWKKKLQHITHWIVAVGFDNYSLIVIDPAYGKIKIPKNRFSDLMNTEKHVKMNSAIISVSK